MPTVLIVGASRGIGREFLRQYAQEGWRVHATTRSGSLPDDVLPPWADVTGHMLDVRNAGQIEAMARALGDQPVDLYIHSAGIYDRVGGPFSRSPAVPPDEVFAVNRDGPLEVGRAVFGNVRGAPSGRMGFLSSAEGIRGAGRTLGVYGQSKAALNDAIRGLAPRWARQGVIGLALHPGWVRTDLGGPRGAVSVEESVTGLRSILENAALEHNGGFFDFRGNPLPW